MGFNFDSLSAPWQAALEMAWEAYCAGTVPIGAVVADAEGRVVSRGRNRIFEDSAPRGQICRNELAHAEINALLSLDLDDEACRRSALYTTMEPCPLCMGALYMSDVKTAYYAARDPWAGSANLLGTTPYLSRKPFHIFPPSDPLLETALIALHTEFELFQRGEDILDSVLFEKFNDVLPGAVQIGLALHRAGNLRRMQREAPPARDAFHWLMAKLG